MWDQLLRLLLLHALFLRICKVHGIIIPSPRIILLPPPDPILPRLHAKHRGLLQLLRRARDAIPSGKAQIIQRVGPTFFREFHSEIHDARPWLLHWELYFVRVAAAYPPAWLDLGGYWNWHFLLLVFIIIFLSMRFIRRWSGRRRPHFSHFRMKICVSIRRPMKRKQQHVAPKRNCPLFCILANQAHAAPQLKKHGDRPVEECGVRQHGGRGGSR